MSRYTITLEYVGDSRPHYVARFCGDFIDSSRFKYEAIQMMKGHANNTRPALTGNRNPTPSEIRFGHGATHYADIPHGQWLNDDGTLKRRVKIDGLVYSRG